MNKYYVYAILNAVLFGLSGIIVNFAYREGFSARTILIVQYAISASITFLYLLIFNRKHLKIDKITLFKLLFVSSASNILTSIFYYTALENSSVVIITLLLYTHPIMYL